MYDSTTEASVQVVAYLLPSGKSLTKVANERQTKQNPLSLIFESNLGLYELQI